MKKTLQQKSEVSVIKSVNEELKQALFVVLEPQNDDGTTNDLHHDWYSAEEVRKACENFNKFSGKANLFHLIETEDFSIIESYITPCDLILNDELVKEGTWLAKCQFHTDGLWDGVKSGELNGLSIQARASVEYLEEE